MAGTYPSINDNYVNLLKKICSNTASLSDAIASDVSSVAGTAGNVLVNGGTAAATGAIVLSLPTALTSINSITAAAATDLALLAGTGNQNITLTPSGTGINTTAARLQSTFVGFGADITKGSLEARATRATVSLYSTGAGADSKSTVIDNDTSGNFRVWFINDAGASGGAAIAAIRSGVSVANIQLAGHTLLGGLTTDGTGVLQFPAATTIAGGIVFGTDMAIFRDNVTGAIGISQINGNIPCLNFYNNTALRGSFQFSGTNCFIDASTGGSVAIRTNGTTTALTLGTDQSATLTGPNFSGTSSTGLNLFSGTANQGITLSGDITGGTNGGVVLQNQNSYNGSSGTQFGTKILNTINQTSTAGFTDLLISRTQTAAGSGGQYLIDTQVAATSQFRLVSNGRFDRYSGITLAGWGVPAIQSAGRVTAQSAANASISTYTVGASDGSFAVSANMNVTVVTVLSTTLTVTYTDESNAARTMILPVLQLAGNFIAGGLITGLGAWETPVMHIRCKASTAITILTSAGTFTGVTYTAEGCIRQTA